MERVWVDWRGQKILVPDMACPNGHRLLGDSWALCADCGFADVHFRCRECGAMVRDPAHVCRA